MERFVCKIGRENVQLDPIQLQTLGIEWAEQLHMNSEKLFAAAILTEKSNWIRLPFCNTLCAEGLGAKADLMINGAKIRETVYRTPEELPNHLNADFPRLNAMKSALGFLKQEQKQVIYQIEGPFTLLSYLLPMGKMFSCLRKPSGREMLKKAENWILEYAGIAAAHGVKMFSFADPMATIDILGEKVFTDIYRECCQRILLRLRAEYPKVAIHLCGRLTQSLLDIDACHTELWEPETACSNYVEALSQWCDYGKGPAMAGQYCLNLLETARPFITKVLFNEQEE